mgnify:CR=1 FL=1
MQLANLARAGQFLSTPSARRATFVFELLYQTIMHFYPRPPRGGRPSGRRGPSQGAKFLSTPSARRATPAHVRPRPDAGISIHALREEGDRSSPASGTKTPEISIHALREEGDPCQMHPRAHTAGFLSTPSARRATPG